MNYGAQVAERISAIQSQVVGGLEPDLGAIRNAGCELLIYENQITKLAMSGFN